MKWGDGGIIDEESLPESYQEIYKKQLLKLANSDNNDIKTINNPSSEAAAQKKSNVENQDMELDDQSDMLPSSPPPPQPVTPQNLRIQINSSTPQSQIQQCIFIFLIANNQKSML
jgi:hypothetical protein